MIQGWNAGQVFRVPSFPALPSCPHPAVRHPCSALPPRLPAFPEQALGSVLSLLNFFSRPVTGCSPSQARESVSSVGPGHLQHPSSPFVPSCCGPHHQGKARRHTVGVDTQTRQGRGLTRLKGAFWVWKLPACDQGAGGVAACKGLSPQLADSHLLPVSFRGCPLVCVCVLTPPVVRTPVRWGKGCSS